MDDIISKPIPVYVMCMCAQVLTTMNDEIWNDTWNECIKNYAKYGTTRHIENVVNNTLFYSPN